MQNIQAYPPPQVFPIRLTNGMITLVDEDDFDRVSTHKWQYHPAGYAQANHKGKKLLLHRFLLEDLLAPRMVVDHVNHNRLDNRLGNLRVCTQAQNAANKGMNIRNTTGYKGVTFNTRVKKYVAVVKANGRSFYLGKFDTAIEAARAYDAAAILHHVEYANHNNA